LLHGGEQSRALAEILKPIEALLAEGEAMRRKEEESKRKREEMRLEEDLRKQNELKGKDGENWVEKLVGKLLQCATGRSRSRTR
jgi:hypothetical protein